MGVGEFTFQLFLPCELQPQDRISGNPTLVFFHVGYPAAIPTMLVIVFVTWIHASWLLEVMARTGSVYLHAIAVTV